MNMNLQLARRFVKIENSPSTAPSTDSTTPDDFIKNCNNNDSIICGQRLVDMKKQHEKNIFASLVNELFPVLYEIESKIKPWEWENIELDFKGKCGKRLSELGINLNSFIHRRDVQ